MTHPRPWTILFNSIKETVKEQILKNTLISFLVEINGAKLFSYLKLYSNSCLQRMHRFQAALETNPRKPKDSGIKSVETLSYRKTS